MAEKPKAKPAAAAAKKKKPGSKRWTMYADGKVKNRECPKCGAGYYLAEHKNRRSCGKCSYTEFK